MKHVQIDHKGSQVCQRTFSQLGITGYKDVWVDLSMSYRRYNARGNYTFTDGQAYIPLNFYMSTSDWSTVYVNAAGF